MERPENLFNEKFVDRKLVTMSPYKQRKTVRALNKLAKNFKGLVPKRESPQIQPLNHRPRTFVRIRDIMGVLHELLATRKRTVVHFGLDLYAILLCGQRFLADIKEIERGLKGLVEKNQEKQLEALELSFEMRIGKNQ